MAVASNEFRNKLLRQQTAENGKELVKTLIKARDRVEDKIVKAARQRKFGQVKSLRTGLYKDLSQEYLRLQGNLDGWTKDSILNTSKPYHKLAAADLLAKDSIRAQSFTQFSSKHMEEYFELVHPFNAEKLAAVNVHMNPQITRMLDSDVRQIRSAVIDVFREAQVAALTSEERFKLLRDSVMGVGEKPASWAFIDASGKKWKPNNYFDMLNRTVTANIARTSYNDSLIDEGRDLVQIIGGLSANSHPACVAWVGKVVSLTGATPGYQPISKYIEAGGFHPNCVHTTVYVSQEFEPNQKLLEEQKGEPAPKVSEPKPKAKQSISNPPQPRRKKRKVESAEDAQRRLDKLKADNREATTRLAKMKESNRKKALELARIEQQKRIAAMQKQIDDLDAETKRIDKELSKEDRRSPHP